MKNETFLSLLQASDLTSTDVDYQKASETKKMEKWAFN